MSLCFSKISLIVAYSDDRVIGNKNKLPWRIPEDLAWFKKKTLGNSIIMGYNTYKSLDKPLPNRLNLVLSTKKRKLPNEVIQVYNLEEAAYVAEKENPDKEIFFIGGEKVYQQILPFVKTMYITKVYKKYKGDKFFPDFDINEFNETSRIQNKTGIQFDFITYKRKKHEETKQEPSEESPG